MTVKSIGVRNDPQKERHRKIMIIGVSSIVFLVAFWLMKYQVYALSGDVDESSSALKKIYEEYDDLFSQNDIVKSAVRFMGMGILSLFVMLADAASGLFDKSFGLMDFTNYTPVKKFLDDWDVVWVALICVSLAWLGITLVFNSDKKPKVATNLCVGILVITSMTWMVSQMNTLLTKDIRNEILGTTSQETIYSMLGNNVHDLLYIDSIAGLENLGETNADGEKYADVRTPLNKKAWKALDINEVVFPDDVKDESRVIAEYHKTYLSDEQGKYYSILTENYDGVAWTDLLNTYYYRYSIDWVAAMLEMIAIAIIYLFFTYKVVRTFYEIVFQEVLAILYSANVTNGQKALKILDGIKDSYIIIMLSLVSVRLYLIATSYVASKSWGGFSKGMILFFIALAVIDGPNIVQKITGMDAGMSDGMQKLMSVMYGTNAAMGLGRMAYGAGKSVGSKAAGLGRKFMNSSESTQKEAAEAAFGSGAGVASKDEENRNQNDMSQDAGAQFNSVNEDNDIHQEENGSSMNQQENGSSMNQEKSGNTSDPLNENVNADGRSGEVNDESIAAANPDKQKADTLNGMNPLGSNQDDFGTTARMDKELDAKDTDRSFGQEKRGVLNTNSSFEKYMGGSEGTPSGISSGSKKSSLESGSRPSSVPSSTGSISGRTSNKTVNSIKKEVLKEAEHKGSEE